MLVRAAVSILSSEKGLQCNGRLLILIHNCICVEEGNKIVPIKRTKECSICHFDNTVKINNHIDYL